MAYQTGTATDHEDLWDKLIAFLTTDAELVANNENWSVAWEAPSNAPNLTDVVLAGPGLSQQDTIYVGFRRVDFVADDVSQFYIRGMTGIISNAEQYYEHVHVSEAVVAFARANPMDYWFFANGRRFVMIAQVGTVYEALYGGFFLPYADPTQYTYPMFIGGSAGANGPNEPEDWRSTAAGHSVFVYPDYDSGGTGHNPSAWMLSPQGDWLSCSKNTINSNVYVGPSYFGRGGGLGFYLEENYDNDSYGYVSILERMIESYGEGYGLTPITLTQSTPNDQTYGILDGVYHVPGRGQSVENKIAAEDSVHVVFQNTFRTGLLDYYAVTRGPEDSNSGVEEDSNS